MNRTPPCQIGGAKVICYTLIDDRHKFTGNCKQIAGGEVMGPMAGLAICQYDKDDALYLFGCDSEWNSATDTWHQSIEEAKEHAEFEYQGTMDTWTQMV